MNLVAMWKRFHHLPGGRWFFSRLLGRMIPYSGSIRPLIEEFEPGHAKVSIQDRRAVRNHLNSIHAVALMNLAELTSGLTMVGGLDRGLRGILTGFQIEFVKKARGKITGEARCDVPTAKERKNYTLTVELKNQDGDTVCRANASWLISPVT